MFLTWTFGPSETLAVSIWNNAEQPVINQFPKTVVKFNPFANDQPVDIEQIEPKPSMNSNDSLPPQSDNSGQFIPKQPTSNQPFIPKQFYELKEKQNASREQVENTLNQPKEQSANREQAFVLNAGEFLLRTIDMIVKQLEILRDRIASEKFASSPVFVASIKLIDSDVSYIQSISEEIGKAQGDPQAIRDLADEFRSFWREHRFDGRLIAGRLMAFKMSVLFAKTNNLEVEFGKQIEILKLRGVEVAVLENLMNDYRIKINTANGKLDQAQTMLANSNQVDGLADNEQTKLMREAGALMNEARQILNKAVNELKKQVSFK